MSARTKRIGRPFKPPSGKRAQLTLLVRADIKREIDKAAQKNGRTQSQEAELRFETKLVYDRTFKAMGKSAAEIQAGNLKAAAVRDGWTLSRRTFDDGKTWWESLRQPGYPPVLEPGEFVTTIAEQEAK